MQFYQDTSMNDAFKCISAMCCKNLSNTYIYKPDGLYKYVACLPRKTYNRTDFIFLENNSGDIHNTTHNNYMDTYTQVFRQAHNSIK